MIVLDAYALVAFLGAEPAPPEVERLLRGGDCVVSAVNLAEAVDVTCRVHGLALDEVRDVVRTLTLGGQLRVSSADEASGWRAADIRQSHYAKKTCELSLADCFLIGAAASPGDQIATSDPPVAAVARSERLQVIALPDSTGRGP